MEKKSTCLPIEANWNKQIFPSFIKIFQGQRLNVKDGVSYAALTKSTMARKFDRRAIERPDYLLYMDRKLQLLKKASNVKTILRKRNQQTTRVQDISVVPKKRDFQNNPAREAIVGLGDILTKCVFRKLFCC